MSENVIAFTGRSPNWIVVEGEEIPKPPPGVHNAPKTLADGRKVIYDYAWKSGPPLVGLRGSPQYLASYTEAHARRNEVRAGKDTVGEMIIKYKASTGFTDLAAATKLGRTAQLDVIMEEFGSMPRSALNDRRTRGVFLDWRQEIVDGTKPPVNPRTPARLRVKLPDGTEKRKGSRAQADRHWEALARLCSWSWDRGEIDVNPCIKAGRMHRGSRRDFIWTVDRELRFFRGWAEREIEPAPYYHQDAYFLGVWLGQREYDLVHLMWSAYDGTYICLQQHKRRDPTREGKRLRIKVAAPLKRHLDMMQIRQGVAGLSLEERSKRNILLNSLGLPWKNSDAFSTAFHTVARSVGVPDRTYHDLRGTCVVRFALADSTIPQIIAITGHSLADAQTILETHYLCLDEGLADAAVAKREGSAQFVTDLAPRHLALVSTTSGALPTDLPTETPTAPEGALSVPEEKEKILRLIKEVEELKRIYGQLP